MTSNFTRKLNVSSILTTLLPSLALAALSGCAASAEVPDTPDTPAEAEATATATQALSAPPAPPPLTSWFKLPSWSGDANIMLLTDGRVMGLNGYNYWAGDQTVWALKPSSAGKYETGTWSPLASMNSSRLYYGSNVLPDGRVMVVGGENGTGTGKGEVYDPVSNAWTQTFLSPDAKDTETILLPDGNVYVAWNSTLYDPSKNTVTPWSTYPTGGFDEAGFVLLPDQSYLTIPSNADPTAAVTAYRYVSGRFVLAGTLPPGGLYDGKTEIGPGLLLPNGNVFWLGGNGKTAIYTPPTSPQGTGTWTAGPNIPDGYKADDSPAVLLRNGHVLFLADAGAFDSAGKPIFAGPTRIYDYDPVANLMSAGAPAWNEAAFSARMLALPTGQVLLSTGPVPVSLSTGVGGYIYTPPAGGSAWAPAISSISAMPALGQGVYQVTGTNFNGVSEGAAYGDDAEMSSNYPLVRFENGTSVVYARTFGWAPGVVGLSTAVRTTNFSVPAGLANGAWSLVVVANGIPSPPLPVNVANGVITTSSEPCTPSKTVSGGNSGPFNTTGAYCFRTPDVIHGWGCSSFDGRTVQANGQSTSCGALPLAGTFNGYTYFNASAGSYPWAAINWW